MRSLFVLLLYFSTLFATQFDAYFEGAAHAFSLDATLLKRIATIESGLKPNAINLNKNGTRDIGLMQINTIHLKRLSKIGITEQTLRDPQVNIYVGALLLSSHIRRQGYNLEAIGCYHSANPLYKNQWLKRLAMANITNAKDQAALQGEDPRTRFVQQQLKTRTQEKIALGMNPKNALHEAKSEVDRLMGYQKNS